MEKLEEIIKQIKEDAKESLVPIVRDKTLCHIKKLIEQTKPAHILEIGTAVGYSGLEMLHSGAKKLTTIEKNEDRFISALKNFERAGVSNAVRALNGDAIDMLKLLEEEGERFEFVFLDGPKGQYIKYLPIIKKLLTGGGILFADNVGVLGLVAHSELVTHKNRTMVRNMQAFLNEVQNDGSFDTEIFDIDDGYAICRKK